MNGVDPIASQPQLGPKFQVTETIRTPWHNVKGMKWTIWSIVLIAYIIGVVFAAIFYSVVHHPLTGPVTTPTTGAVIPPHTPVWVPQILDIVASSLIMPFITGAIMAGVQHLRGAQTTPATAFRYLSKYLPLAATQFLKQIIYFVVGFILGVIFLLISKLISLPTHIFSALILLAAAVLAVFFSLALPYVADKNLSPIKAITTSFHTIKSRFWRAAAVFLIVFLLLFLILVILATIYTTLTHLMPNSHIPVTVTAIASAVLYIWILPFWIMVIANVYHQLVDKQAT